MPEYEPTTEQQAILNHDASRHARVSAGPGSGKSATLVQLVSRLKHENESLKIKLLTFTRAATAELAKKVSNNPSLAATKPSTVHSFAISALMENPRIADLPRPLRIADDWEDKNIIRPGLAARTGVGLKKLDKLRKEMASGWESLQPEQDQGVTAQERARFNGVWREHRGVYGYTLLSELPYALKRALEQYPDLAGLDYEVLVVDEYQDLNACELAILKSIAGRGCTILGAGDEDQSIYSGKRAAPEGLGRFLSDYPGAADYNLSIAQRYGAKIIDWSSYVIEGDPDRRADKPRLTPASSANEGEVALLAFRGERAEAKGIASIAKNLIDTDGIPAVEIMILMRGDHNGQFSKAIKEELTSLGVQFSDPSSVKQALSEKSARKMLALFRLLADTNDSIAWAALIQIEDGVGSTFVNKVYDNAKVDGAGFGATLNKMYQAGFTGISNPVAAKVRSLMQAVHQWLIEHSVPMSEPENRWGHWMIENCDGTVVPNPSEQVQQILSAIDERIEPGGELSRYLGQIWPLARDWAQAESSGVRIMSMAAAKGLTVRATIIAGLENDIVPRSDGDQAEERRLLYVAMTRPKEVLIGTWARSRRGPGARAGSGNTGVPRTYTNFLADGPVTSQEGNDFIGSRWNS